MSISVSLCRLHKNIRLLCKNKGGTNTLAYFTWTLVTKTKSFVVLTAGEIEN
jgi:hypothetical protein